MSILKVIKRLMDKSNVENKITNSACEKELFSPALFEGFVQGQLKCSLIQNQGEYLADSNKSGDNGLLRPQLIKKPVLTKELVNSSVQFVGFLPGGSRLLCIEIKTGTIADRLPRNLSFPLSRIIVYGCEIDQSQNCVTSTNKLKHFSPNIFEDSTFDLHFLAIFCVHLSNNGKYLAVCGINKNNKKHLIVVYEISTKDSSAAEKTYCGSHLSNTKISVKAVHELDESGVLSAKITACRFSPDSSFLVTTFSNDFFLNSRHCIIDFWNFKAGIHVGRLDPVLNCKNCNRRPRGYISSILFSPNGDIIIFCTSALQVLLYSMVMSTFGSSVYSIRNRTEFREDKWEPMYCCWTQPYGSNIFVVCSQDGTLTMYQLNAPSLTLLMLKQSNIFSRNSHPQTLVHGIEFSPASSNLFIRTSYDETVVYNVLEDIIHLRLACNNLTLRDTPQLVSGSINISTSVSRDGEEVAIAVGETIQIFLLRSENLTLKSLCRNLIIRIVPENKIMGLSLPKCLQSYLMFEKYAVD